jgi:hypothetical protein
VPTSEWDGGTRFGSAGDLYYRVMRGTVTGAAAGDVVKVWFTGGGQQSGSFTFDVLGVNPPQVLVVAAEDYTGASNEPAYASSTGPNHLGYYTDALTANGIDFDVYDVDARGRRAPDHLGVLGHYDAVVWYMGNDLITREPAQVPGTGASTLANSEMLELRAYLNEGGRVLYSGRHAGWQFANAFEYNPVSTPPYCAADVKRDDGCLTLSDDFLQYWLGADVFLEDAGTDPATGEPYGVVGRPGGTFADMAWTLNGGDSAGHHAGVADDQQPARPSHLPAVQEHRVRAVGRAGRGGIQPALRVQLRVLGHRGRQLQASRANDRPHVSRSLRRSDALVLRVARHRAAVGLHVRRGAHARREPR